MVNSWLRKLAPKRPVAGVTTAAAEPSPRPPLPDRPPPGLRKTISIQTLRCGDRLTIYACACYQLRARNGHLIAGHVCRRHAAADFDRWERELQP